MELKQADSLIPIQAQGDRPILFGVHHIYFKDLAENLGPDQPIYALRYGIGGTPRYGD
ncbi:MAG: hypothetical protein HC796_02465 [Synechococcaceae cyanobacterium RL_1_2]|nr:hypothetical protein [Synechococcaceae cyanobacterium RL_1_2]